MRWSREKDIDPESGAQSRLKLKKYLRTAFCLGCLLAAGVDAAFGYVIEASKIIELTAQQLGRAAALKVEQRLTTYVLDQQTRQVPARESVSYQFPNIFRLDLTADKLRRSILAYNDRTLAVVNDQIDPRAESELDLYHYLLLHRSGSEISRVLNDYGIDTTISSLGKFEKKIAFVIGAQYPDENYSQLWIDKESLLPMRWILVSISPISDQPRPVDPDLNESEDIEPDQPEPDQPEPEPVLEHLEFRFSLWRKFDRLQYPMRVDILHDGVLLREVRVDDVQVNPALDKSLLNIDQQKARFPQSQKYQEALPEEEGTDDIQKTIDNFKKKFE